MTSGGKQAKVRGGIWGSNFLSIFLLALLILSMIKVSREVVLRYEIDREIKSLEGKLSDLQSRTEKMDKLMAYLNTDEYIEKQARLQFNLSKPGEKQINLTNNQTVAEGANLATDQSNLVKWFNYFFK